MDCAHRIGNIIRNMQMTFSAQTPAGGDPRTLLATRTMQSVRCLAASHAPLQIDLNVFVEFFLRPQPLNIFIFIYGPKYNILVLNN